MKDEKAADTWTGWIGRAGHWRKTGDVSRAHGTNMNVRQNACAFAPGGVWAWMPANHAACHPLATLVKSKFIRSVNVIRTSRIIRTTCILMALLGWVALSQRCALWQLLAARQTGQVQKICCHHDSPEPGKAPADAPRSAECCKALKVLVPDGTKAPATPVADSPPLPAEWLSVVLQPISESSAVTGTGPPADVPAFAEFVLNRSLLSHAPPTPA